MGSPMMVLGSSPRVRGKLGGGCETRAVCGLIPACAGKTQKSTESQMKEKAHPRVCGEN